MNRSSQRQTIIKILYQTYIFESKKVSYMVDDLLDEDEVYTMFISDAITYIKSHQEEIDNLANKYMKDWTIDRLSKVDKAIISLAIYELLATDTPNVVAINEAIELSKKYSDEKVTKLINSVLDKILHEEVKDE